MFAPKPDANMLRSLAVMARDQPANTYLKLWKESLNGALVQARDPITIHQIQGSIKTLDELMIQMTAAEKEMQRQMK